MMRALLLSAGVLLAVPAAEEAPRVVFGDQFADHYPELVDDAAQALAGLPVEAPVITASPDRAATATVARTDGARVPYDDARATIAVRCGAQPPAWITAHGFRTVTARWINDRLLFVSLGLGHVAEVDAIYDLQARRWLYRDSLTYPP